VIFVLIIFGCTVTNKYRYFDGIRFDGTSYTDKESGIILNSKEEKIVGITSYYADVNLILPYGKWIFSSNEQYALFGKSNVGIVSVIFEKYNGTTDSHYNDIVKNLKKSPGGEYIDFKYKSVNGVRVLMTKVNVYRVIGKSQNHVESTIDTSQIQVGVFSVKLRSNGEHAVYHYSKIFDDIDEEDCSNMVKHAAMGFTPNFKEAMNKGTSN